MAPQVCGAILLWRLSGCLGFQDDGIRGVRCNSGVVTAYAPEAVLLVVLMERATGLGTIVAANEGIENSAVRKA